MNLTKEHIQFIVKSTTKNEAIKIIDQNVSIFNNSNNHDESNNITLSDIYRNSIVNAALLDIIQTFFNKGFDYNECLISCSLYFDLLNEIKKDSSTISTTLNYFGTTLKKLSLVLNNTKLKLLIDYINHLMFLHFSLYKYVFTCERDNAIVYEEKLFITPSSILDNSNNDNESIHRLKNAKTQEQWSYEKRVNELNEKEKQMINMHNEHQKQLEREENDIASNLIKYIQNNAYDVEEPISEETIKKLTDEMAQPLLNAAVRTIKSDFENLKDRVALHNERSKLIRPDDTHQHLAGANSSSRQQQHSTKK